MLVLRLPIALGLFLALLSPVTAQALDCPDMVTSRVPATVRYGQPLGCSGARLQVSGVIIDSSQTQCPGFAHIVPERDVPEHREGSHTFVEQVGSVQTQLVTFRCKTEYWFALIPVGAGCEVLRSITTGRLPTYAVRPCAKLAVGGL